jgi:hypothetical protein
VNLLGDNVDAINKSVETLIDACKEVDIEVNIEDSKYMLVSCYQNSGQNLDIKKPIV